MPSAKQVVITAGSPSGIAATAKATAILRMRLIEDAKWTLDTKTLETELMVQAARLNHSAQISTKQLEIVDAASKHLNKKPCEIHWHEYFFSKAQSHELDQRNVCS